MSILQTRRRLVTSASAAGVVGLLGSAPALADEGPPETTAVRLPKFFPASCEIPQYVADELLRAEGLIDARYVGEESGDSSEWIARGELDFDWNYAATHITSIE